VALGAASLAPAAPAHGPCRCTAPAAGHPGDRIAVSSPAVRAVWNPHASDLFDEDPLAREVRPEAARIPLPVPQAGQLGGFSFRLPDVPPGRYLVIVHDGSEAGQHYTWDFVRVLRAAARERREAYDLTFWLVIVAGAALVVGTVVALRLRRPDL
jgi:hypothetical protein